MRALKTLLAVNGLVFLIRALLNVFRPTSFYLESGAPEYASDAVRVLGITYGVLGSIQLGMWRVSDRRAVLVLSSGSLLFAVGVAVQAMNQAGSSTDRFHQMRLASAAENVAVAGLYAFLLYREHQSATPPPLTSGGRDGRNLRAQQTPQRTIRVIATSAQFVSASVMNS